MVCPWWLLNKKTSIDIFRIWLVKSRVFSSRESLLLAWIESNDLHTLVLVIYGIDSQRVLERWTFGVETDPEVAQSHGSITREKDLNQIQKEIQAIIRQITASITFLPLHEEQCTLIKSIWSRLVWDSCIHESECRSPTQVGRQRPSFYSQRRNSEIEVVFYKCRLGFALWGLGS